MPYRAVGVGRCARAQASSWTRTPRSSCSDWTRSRRASAAGRPPGLSRRRSAVARTAWPRAAGMGAPWRGRLARRPRARRRRHRARPARGPGGPRSGSRRPSGRSRARRHLLAAKRRKQGSELFRRLAVSQLEGQLGQHDDEWQVARFVWKPIEVALAQAVQQLVRRRPDAPVKAGEPPRRRPRELVGLLGGTLSQQRLELAQPALVPAEGQHLERVVRHRRRETELEPEGEPLRGLPLRLARPAPQLLQARRGHVPPPGGVGATHPPGPCRMRAASASHPARSPRRPASTRT